MFGKQQLRNEPQTKIKNSLLTASISFHAYYILFSLCLSSFKRQILPCTIIVISQLQNVANSYSVPQSTSLLVNDTIFIVKHSYD